MPKTDAPPKNSRDKAAARRREKILMAALTCFLQKGYHQTGVRDIAKRAGVSLGNLYNHFAGKHDVLVEIAALERSELQPFLTHLSGSGTPMTILDEFIETYARYVAKPENVLTAIEITSEAVRKPDIGTLFMANQKELILALKSVLERGIADGQFRSHLDPTETAHLIVQLIEGSAYRSFLNKIAMKKLVDGVKDFTMSAIRS